MVCNINQTDRINRGVIGIILCIAAGIEMSSRFFMIVGLVLVLQAAVGWCRIPYLLDKFKPKT